MGIVPSSLSELSVDRVQIQHAFVRSLVLADNPNLDVYGGAFDELVLYYSGVLSELNQEQLDRVKRTGSLIELADDPTLGGDEDVAAVASNFLVVRREGTFAKGEVSIYVNTLAPVTVAKNAVFVANGQRFLSDASYVARTSQDNVIATTDRALTARANGTYSFTISVTAEVAGSESRLVKDTQLVPVVPPLNFVKAITINDFSQGADPESLDELINRLPEGPAVKALASPWTMLATLRDNDSFANIIASSIVGMGDPEMLRDKHWIWPSSGGGRVDWYIRTQERAIRTQLSKEALLVEKTTDGGGIWQFEIDRDEAPGYYDVVSITYDDEREITGTLEVVSDTRGWNLNGDTLPDIANTRESNFSRYQTSVVRFSDPNTSTSAMTVNTTTADYVVTVRALPLISDIQDTLGATSQRQAAADLLVRAPVPCFLQLNLTIYAPSGVALNLADIANKLAATVNTLGFSGRLDASRLTSTVQSLLSSSCSLSPIDMFGRLQEPSGAITYLRSSSALLVPDRPSDMVSDKTVNFFLAPEDVDISVSTL